MALFSRHLRPGGGGAEGRRGPGRRPPAGPHSTRRAPRRGGGCDAPSRRPSDGTVRAQLRSRKRRAGPTAIPAPVPPSLGERRSTNESREARRYRLRQPGPRRRRTPSRRTRRAGAQHGRRPLPAPAPTTTDRPHARPTDRDGGRGATAQRGYLVDPASSHMLVSKIKPCMSKYELSQAKLRMAH